MKLPNLAGPLNGTNVVTASDLVRRFGLWQERAGREPVYVLHRGRPRFVLTSIEIMQALCAPHEAPLGQAAAPALGMEALLDLTRDLILIVDRNLVLIAASRAARGYFGDATRPGTPLPDLVRTPSAGWLIEAVLRVVASGLREEIEIGAPFAGRSVSVAIDPVGAGACLRFDDITIVEELAAMRAARAADTDALAATGLAAIGRINLRGYLEAPFGAIAAMAHVDAASLAGTRFVGLIDLGTRVAVGQALETAISARTPVQVDAILFAAGSIAKPVRIGFSPIVDRSLVDAVSVVIVAR